MCGICGILRGHLEEKIDPMLSAMHHRGPDDRGVFVDDTVTLGMTRLSIIDTSPAGHQPMTSEDGRVILVYNGEMYNFREERDILEKKGIVFRSNSDTEVVLKMYDAYGDDLLRRMRGIFAFALYDKRAGPGKERLLLARDHMGVKPLLYTTARTGQFMFASELKALIASSSFERSIDAESLRQLLTFGSIIQPRTMLVGVRMLLPGHFMVVQGDTQRIERYWRMDTDRIPFLKEMSYGEQASELRKKIEEVVSLQLASDVPIGAFLSGGVDSTFLVAAMAKMLGKRVHTFSVGFGPEGAAIDESNDARRIARSLDTIHAEVRISGRDMRDTLGHFVESIDQPSVDGVNSYFVSKAARDSVTVALSGTGGDELFAGYPWFAAMSRYQNVRLRQRIFGAGADALRSAFWRLSAWDVLMAGRYGDPIEGKRSTGDFLSVFARQYHAFGAAGTARLLSPDLKGGDLRIGLEMALDIEPLDSLPDASPVARVSALCLSGYTRNQLLRDIDAVSMGHSLEVRVPFLDHELLDMALSLPDETKLFSMDEPLSSTTYAATGAKRILIEAGKGLLPEGIAEQPKRGFGIPMDAWLKDEMREVLEEVFSPSVVMGRGLLRAEKAVSLKNEFLTGTVHWTKVWLPLVLELWCRRFIDGSK